MEDAHSCVEKIDSLPGCSFFGVFDGHGGAGAAIFASNNLLPKIVQLAQLHHEGKAGSVISSCAGGGNQAAEGGGKGDDPSGDPQGSSLTHTPSNTPSAITTSTTVSSDSNSFVKNPSATSVSSALCSSATAAMLTSTIIEGDAHQHVAAVLEQAYVEVDEYMSDHVKEYALPGDTEDPGTTAVTAVLTPSHVVVAHLGDARYLGEKGKGTYDD